MFGNLPQATQPGGVEDGDGIDVGLHCHVMDLEF